MKHTALYGALGVGITACVACASVQPKAPFEPPPEMVSRVSPIGCTFKTSHEGQMRDGFSLGTLTQHGDTFVTALHFAEKCAYYFPPVIEIPVHDLARMATSNPDSCNDAEVGERVAFLGYPGTYANGEPKMFPWRDDAESDLGVVTKASPVTITVPAYDHPLILFEASSEKVRPGYSGGGVFSQVDGRLVGIIVAANPDRSKVYFAPVSTICKAVEVFNEQSR